MTRPDGSSTRPSIVAVVSCANDIAQSTSASENTLIECTSSLDVKSLYSPRRDRNNWNVLREVAARRRVLCAGSHAGFQHRHRLARRHSLRMPYAPLALKLDRSLFVGVDGFLQMACSFLRQR